MHEIIEQYLRAYKGRLKPSTFIDYRSILQHHISRFATFEELNDGLEDYLSSAEISGKRKNNILSATGSFVSWARRREIWGGSFFKVPRFSARSSKIKPLNPEETRLIMTYAPHPYKDFFQLSFLTGVRTGEALGLKFEDFDLNQGLLSIRRALTCGHIVSPKTASGERDIPLLRPLREIYQRRQRNNEEGSPWFFYSSHGGIIARSTLARKWKGLLKAFKIGHRPLYATRHTYASLALAAGEDPLWVAEALGHSRADQLFLRYASFIKGVKEDGEKVISLILGKKSLMRIVR
jgi:integrase